MNHLFAKAAACALALAMLSGCASGGIASSAGSVKTVKKAETPSNGTIAYLPPDDRPANTDRVRYLAKSLGYRLSMPKTALYHTCLDKQDANPGGLRCGDRAALLEWVEAQEKAGCDRYILSLDQLLSGGLLNSRIMSAQPVTLSGGTVLTERQILDRLLKELESDSKNQVYLLDTVMNAAPAAQYGAFGTVRCDALREYAAAVRPVLSGSALSVENIIQHYALSENGGAAARPASLTDSQTQAYLAARARKLRLSAYALAAAKDLAGIHFLIGVDGTVSSGGIQANEISFFKQAAAENALLSGADEAGMMAVCLLYETTVFRGRLPDVQVRCFGGSETNPASGYDGQSAAEIVNAHLNCLRLKASKSSRQLQIFVLTAPEDNTRSDFYCKNIIHTLQKNQADGIPTVLLDASKNSYGTAFQKLLLKKVRLGELLGYAGFGDWKDGAGTALSTGVARWLCLTQQKQCSEAQNLQFLRALSDSLLRDICWKSGVEKRMAAFVRTDLKGNPDNFRNPEIDQDKAAQQLQTLMSKAAAGVLENFSKTNVITSLSPTQTAGCGGLYMKDLSFPWQRSAEIRMKLSLSPMTENHVNIFGFFYS